MASHRIKGLRKTASTEGIDEILDSLRRIVRTLRESATDVERELGISSAQLFVLHVLRDSPAESVNELAGRTHTHQSSVSVVVSRLARNGLVARERSATDVRRVRISLTRRGEELLQRSPQPVQGRLVEALEGLSADVVASLSMNLRSVTRAMGLLNQRVEMLLEEDTSRV